MTPIHMSMKVHFVGQRMLLSPPLAVGDSGSGSEDTVKSKWISVDYSQNKNSGVTTCLRLSQKEIKVSKGPVCVYVSEGI